MKKIPTLFERDWNGDRSRVLPHVTPGCEWVAEGVGTATRKIDGTCCMIRDGQLFKRYEVKRDQQPPGDFDEVDYDAETGKRVGWRPVSDSPEDKWHREAFGNLELRDDGTYELVGPKVQGNPEQFAQHTLVPHDAFCLVLSPDVPRDFKGICGYFVDHGDMEGIVFHHPDGRMAKIKCRDFGLKRKPYK